MSKFNKGDIVQCSDATSKYFMDGGKIVETAGCMYRVALHTHNKVAAFFDVQLTLIQAAQGMLAQAGMPAPKAAPVACHIHVGDEVKYIGSESKLKGARGTVQKIYKVIVGGGTDYYAAMVQCQWGDEEIPCDSLIACQPAIPSHYIPVMDEKAEPEKKPFEHSDLGTDLSGDELMESIRSICGR